MSSGEATGGERREGEKAVRSGILFLLLLLLRRWMEEVEMEMEMEEKGRVMIGSFVIEMWG